MTDIFFTEDMHFLAKDLLKHLNLSLHDVIKGEQWLFTRSLPKLSSEAIGYLMRNHARLGIMHEMLRVESCQNAKDYCSIERTQRIIAALLHAQALEYIYLNQYIKIPEASVVSLRKSQAFYRAYLKKANIIVPEPYVKTKPYNALDQFEATCCNATPTMDFIRLLINRGRRMLLFSLAVFSTFEAYKAWVRFYDPFISSLLVYQACVLLPRFIINLTHILKHLFSTISPGLRVYQTNTALQARLFECAYDFGWLVHGVLGALVLVGPLAPLAMYLTVIVPLYNSCMNAIQFFLMRSRFQQLEKTYQMLLNQSDNMMHKKEINRLLACLYEKSQHALMPLGLRTGVSSSIFITASVILFLNVNPWIPFVAATLAVLVTLAGRLIPQYLPKQSHALDKCFEQPSVAISSFFQAPKNGAAEEIRTPDLLVRSQQN